MNSGKIRLAGIDVDIELAKLLIAGYCFYEEKPDRPILKPPSGHDYGTLPKVNLVPKWAYRTYDCSPRSPGEDLTGPDIALAAGLELSMNFDLIRAVLSVAPAVSECVSEVASESFWEISANEFEDQTNEETDVWRLNRAWWLLMSVQGSGVAYTHKILHHKWPSLFPVLDSKTISKFETGHAWEGIHGDLNHAPDNWEELEGWFATLAARLGGVPLTRLRLHDILLWTKATGDDKEAEAAGKAILGK